MNHSQQEETWDIVITSGKTNKGLRLGELWRYRDLVMLFVKRDFVANYKQTVLGPLWHFIQPVLTTITFFIIFGRIGGLGTDGIPGILFYMSGIILWTYFSLGLTKTSQTFLSNAHIFSKVYFPRLTIPVSVVISNLISFGIQFLLFGLVLLYYVLFRDYSFVGNSAMLLLPLLVIIMAMLGLGFGILVSSLTTRYRDISFLVGFAVQLAMYMSSIIFPLSQVSGKLKWLILANPMTPVIETFRYAFLGKGELNAWYLLYSFAFATVVMVASILLFRRVEQTFNDTV